MVEPGEVIIAILAFSAAAFSIRAIANAAVRFQEAKYKGGSPSLSSATEARLERIEQAVDSIAIEVERISENQRFTTKLLSDRASTLR
jgi:hypothetical protein